MRRACRLIGGIKEIETKAKRDKQEHRNVTRENSRKMNANMKLEGKIEGKVSAIIKTREKSRLKRWEKNNKEEG